MSTSLTPIHTKVSDVDPGDAGWIWFEGQWYLAQAVDHDHGLMIEIIGNGEFENLSLSADDRQIKDSPWLGISRPPYECDDEKPITHMLQWTDPHARWTFSWRMGEDEGSAISKKISGLLHQSLEQSKAEKLSSSAGGEV